MVQSHMTDDEARCELCGELMPPNESMFKFHGYSGDCPKPPLPMPPSELDQLRAEVAQLRAVVAAADAMRDMGVSIGQQVVHPEGMPDDRALYEFIGLFDGPFQRDYDAARAALKAAP